MDKGALVLVASYTKCGGSWLTWMLIDIIYQPEWYCDIVNKTHLDHYIKKTEIPLGRSYKPTIHIFRHPLDVVCSAWNYVHLTDRFKMLAVNEERPTEKEYYDFFIKYGKLKYFNEHIKYMDTYNYGKQAPVQIKYEDMLKNPKKELKKIIKEGPIDRAIKRYSLENCKAREKQAQEKLERNTNPDYSFYYKAKSFYYKDKMSEAQINKGHAMFYDLILEHWPETL